MLIPPPAGTGKTPPAAGPFAVWPAVLALWGPGSRSEPHAHHAMHVFVALSGELQVELGDGTRQRTRHGFVVGPDVEHAVTAEGCQVLFLFVDPESAIGERLLGRSPGALTLLGDGDVVAVQEAARSGGLSASTLEPWLTALTGGPVQPASRMHPRVRRVLRMLRDGRLPLDDTSADALAAAAGLSVSRFLHVFSDSVGVPPRTYVRWLRLQRAAGAIIAGQKIGEAAHAAGFADAAHLSRTFRSMFGVSASELLQRSRFVQADAIPERAT